MSVLINSLVQMNDISGGYQAGSLILKGISLSVGANETVAVVGQNGAGKSTLAKAIMGMLPFRGGSIIFDGKDIGSCTPQSLRSLGVGYFMQGGRVFPHLSVTDNLSIAGWDLTSVDRQGRIAEMTTYFELLSQSGSGVFGREASYLSGGEKNQLAMAMVLMQRPRFLILDEPSAGLSPGNIERLYVTLHKIREQEPFGILLIEQHVRAAVAFSERVLLLKEGRVAQDTLTRTLNNDDEIEKFFFN
jgi:ABC-type branched-subunit amino acid transport system ATPase component